MDPNEAQIFDDIIRRNGLNRLTSDESDALPLESLAHIRDSFVCVLEERLREIHDLGSVDDFGGHEELINLLTLLMKNDKRLKQPERGAEVVALGKGSLMFPDKGQVMFFSGDLQVVGEYQGYALSEYWEHMDIPVGEDDCDYPVDKNKLRPFGIHFFLSYPRVIDKNGKTISTDEDFALLPLNYTELYLYQRASV